MSKHDLWHLTWTFDLQSQPSLGQGEDRRAHPNKQKNKRMEGRYQVHYLPALRSIKKREQTP